MLHKAIAKPQRKARPAKIRFNEVYIDFSHYRQARAQSQFLIWQTVQRFSNQNSKIIGTCNMFCQLFELNLKFLFTWQSYNLWAITIDWLLVSHLKRQTVDSVSKASRQNTKLKTEHCACQMLRFFTNLRRCQNKLTSLGTAHVWTNGDSFKFSR